MTTRKSKNLTFIDDYCEKAKPGKKDLQNWRYKKHLEKISKQINTITKIQIAIPIQDIQIEQITNIPNVQIAVTSSGYYILKPTHKVTFAAFLDTFRITKYKAHKMLIKLDERTFGFSRKVVWIQSHNVMDSIKTLCKDSHINVKWMSVQEVEHNEPQFDFLLDVSSARGGGYWTTFCDILNSCNARWRPDLYLNIHDGHVFTDKKCSYFKKIPCDLCGVDTLKDCIWSNYVQKDWIFKNVDDEEFKHNNRRNLKAKWTWHFRSNLKDNNHEIGCDLVTGLFTDEDKRVIEECWSGIYNPIKTDETNVLSVCNDDTPGRDSMWIGIMPYDNYKQSIASPVTLNDLKVPKLIKRIKPIIEQFRQITDTPEEYGLYDINAVQLIQYRRKSFKRVHFDGKYLMNHRELIVMTLDHGKRLGVGTWMVVGEAENKNNVINIPKWSIYRMGPILLCDEWHGILTMYDTNRTIIPRGATISLQSTNE
eukprot:969200_1